MGLNHNDQKKLIYKFCLVLFLSLQIQLFIQVSQLFSVELQAAIQNQEKMGKTVYKVDSSEPEKKVENMGSKKWTRNEALTDSDDRISKTFKIPNILQKRVGFWFDIYTKYDSNHFVLHHNKYPWLVFDVVDITSYYKKGTPSWLSTKRGKRHVSRVRKNLKRRLLRLSRRKSFKNLNKKDRKLYNLIKGIRGPIRRNFLRAAYLIRSQVGQKNYIQKGISTSLNFLPLMEKEFADNGLPTELTRIPFVESSFNVNAYSRVGASGIWQIMPRSAKEFLILNRWIDERNSPIKATTFARKHLRRDFGILGSWPLAITAYNHGVGGVRKGVRKMKSRSIVTLISRYKSRSFKFASRNFFTCFLAVLHAEKYKESFYNVPKDIKPLSLTAIKLNKKSKIQKFAQNMGVDMKDLVEHNRDIKKALKRNKHLPKGFTLYLPAASTP